MIYRDSQPLGRTVLCMLTNVQLCGHHCHPMGSASAPPKSSYAGPWQPASHPSDLGRCQSPCHPLDFGSCTPLIRLIPPQAPPTMAPDLTAPVPLPRISESPPSHRPPALTWCRSPGNTPGRSHPTPTGTPSPLLHTHRPCVGSKAVPHLLDPRPPSDRKPCVLFISGPLGQTEIHQNFLNEGKPLRENSCLASCATRVHQLWVCTHVTASVELWEPRCRLHTREERPGHRTGLPALAAEFLMTWGCRELSTCV